MNGGTCFHLGEVPCGEQEVVPLEGALGAEMAGWVGWPTPTPFFISRISMKHQAEISSAQSITSTPLLRSKIFEDSNIQNQMCIDVDHMTCHGFDHAAELPTIC